MTEALSYGQYNVVSACLTNMTIPFCKRIELLTDLTYEILFNAMRTHQYKVKKEMDADLFRLATQGEYIQYIINGICAGLVIISLILIVPVFSWVIKDKSYVLAIFSDIEIDELEQIIKECKSLDLKALRYKKKWVTKYENRPAEFWNKVTKSLTSKKVQKQNEQKEEIKPKIQQDLQIEANIIIVDKKAERRRFLSEIEYFS